MNLNSIAFFIFQINGIFSSEKFIFDDEDKKFLYKAECSKNILEKWNTKRNVHDWFPNSIIYDGIRVFFRYDKTKSKQKEEKPLDFYFFCIIDTIVNMKKYLNTLFSEKIGSKGMIGLKTCLSIRNQFMNHYELSLDKNPHCPLFQKCILPARIWEKLAGYDELMRNYNVYLFESKHQFSHVFEYDHIVLARYFLEMMYDVNREGQDFFKEPSPLLLEKIKLEDRNKKDSITNIFKSIQDKQCPLDELYLFFKAKCNSKDHYKILINPFRYYEYYEKYVFDDKRKKKIREGNSVKIEEKTKIEEKFEERNSLKIEEKRKIEIPKRIEDFEDYYLCDEEIIEEKRKQEVPISCDKASSFLKLLSIFFQEEFGGRNGVFDPLQVCLKRIAWKYIFDGMKRHKKDLESNQGSNRVSASNERLNQFFSQIQSLFDSGEDVIDNVLLLSIACNILKYHMSLSSQYEIDRAYEMIFQDFSKYLMEQRLFVMEMAEQGYKKEGVIHWINIVKTLASLIIIYDFSEILRSNEPTMTYEQYMHTNINEAMNTIETLLSSN